MPDASVAGLSAADATVAVAMADIAMMAAAAARTLFMPFSFELIVRKAPETRGRVSGARAC